MEESISETQGWEGYEVYAWFDDPKSYSEMELNIRVM